ncbi:hypothetical protein P0Y67_07920 [Photobacterium sp. SP02]|uniref:hypothetical protein n=1 Tax=Photobacterium sp. SP02 TaxID=3032280 RepID=UPI00314502AD
MKIFTWFFWLGIAICAGGALAANASEPSSNLLEDIVENTRSKVTGFTAQDFQLRFNQAFHENFKESEFKLDAKYKIASLERWDGKTNDAMFFAMTSEQMAFLAALKKGTDEVKGITLISVLDDSIASSGDTLLVMGIVVELFEPEAKQLGLGQMLIELVNGASSTPNKFTTKQLGNTKFSMMFSKDYGILFSVEAA